MSREGPGFDPLPGHLFFLTVNCIECRTTSVLSHKLRRVASAKPLERATTTGDSYALDI
jgi:hypothetical protein